MQIVVFKGDGKGDQVEIGQGPLRLEGKERVAGFAMFGQVSRVGEKEPLAETIWPAVKSMMHPLKAEVAHGLMVGIGKHQSHTQTPTPGMGRGPFLGGQALACVIQKFTRHTVSRIIRLGYHSTDTADDDVNCN